MYFGIDPIKSSWPEHLLSRLAHLVEEYPDAPMHCYLLVDASFAPALPKAFPWRLASEGSLYEGTGLAGLGTVAPHLLRLPGQPEKRLGWLQDLLAACAGKPMLSLLFSAIPAEPLRAHFQPYLRARTTDGLEWPVRWGDMRVLPGLLAALLPEQREHLLSPLYLWLTVDRQGDPLQWQGGGNTAPTPAGFDCWPLDEAHFGKLVEDAEADAVLNQIETRRPELLSNGSPAHIHHKVSQQLALATRHGIDQTADRLHFAMLGLIFSSGFADAPAMRAALNRIGQGARYQEQLAQLPEDFWAPYSRGTRP